MILREIQKDLAKTFQLFLEAMLRSFELILEAMRTSLAVKSRGYNHRAETFHALGCGVQPGSGRNLSSRHHFGGNRNRSGELQLEIQVTLTFEIIGSCSQL